MGALQEDKPIKEPGTRRKIKPENLPQTNLYVERNVVQVLPLPWLQVRSIIVPHLLVSATSWTIHACPIEA